YTTQRHHGGAQSMGVGADWGEYAESIPVDTTGCDTVFWHFWALHPELAEYSTISLYYWDGADWVLATEAVGTGDDKWHLFEGVIADPSARASDFRIRFDDVVDLGTTPVYLDDLRVTCGPSDGDGDLSTVDVDCDDNDPAHWSD